MIDTPITPPSLAHGIFGATLVYAEHLPLRYFNLPEGEKLPYVKWKDVATKDPETLQRIAARNRGANIGGTPDGDCVVFDLDRKNGKDGFSTAARLEAQIGPLPETLTSTTPNGGEHRFYRVPKGSPCQSRADICGYAGIDIRASEEAASAGYVVMAPSRTADGEYRWKNWDDPTLPPIIATLPLPWLQLACGSDPIKPKEAKPERARKASRDDGDDPKLIEHLGAALKFLDCDDYDVWIACGEALKTLGDVGLELWLGWSAGYAKYDEGDALKKWETFKPTKTGYPAVFAKAQEAGWYNPGGFSCSEGDAVAAAVTEFNGGHAVALVSGSAVIMREGVDQRGRSSVEFMTPGAAATYYKNRTVPVPRTTTDGQVVMKPAPLVDVWLKHPDRRTYCGVTFAPGGDAPEGYYNSWRGLAVEPLQVNIWTAARKCRRFLHHLRCNVCCGNRSHYRYLLAWLADMTQRPGHKQGIAAVLRGSKGTGKSTLAEVMQVAFGAHSFKASKSHQIVGHFNSHLLDKLLIVAEESFFAGSNADNGTLKDLITSDSITIEPKGVNAFEAPSCHRIMMLTNSEWAVPASGDERRFFVLDVGEDHMQDFEYFGAIHDEMHESDGVAAFMTILKNLDISGINLRKVPQTKALEKQKRLSLAVHDQFIFDCLQGGEIAGREWPDGGESTDDPLRMEVYEAYVQYARSMQVRPIAANRFGPDFEKRTGAINYQPTSGDRRRRYGLPPLSEALARFNRQLGIRDEHEE